MTEKRARADNIMRKIEWITDRGSSILVEPGDTYELLISMSCRDKSIIKKGSCILVLEQTNLTPYDEVGPHGYNWICYATNGKTIWSTLEHCIERGLLGKQPNWYSCTYCEHLHREDLRRNCRAGCCQVATKKVQVELCIRCAGTGFVDEQWDDDRRAEPVGCTECNGHGRVQIKFCAVCNAPIYHPAHNTRLQRPTPDGTVIHAFVLMI